MKKIEMYACKSYYNDNNELVECTCGKCAESMNSLNRDGEGKCKCKCHKQGKKCCYDCIEIHYPVNTKTK